MTNGAMLDQHGRAPDRGTDAALRRRGRGGALDPTVNTNVLGARSDRRRPSWGCATSIASMAMLIPATTAARAGLFAMLAEMYEASGAAAASRVDRMWPSWWAAWRRRATRPAAATRPSARSTRAPAAGGQVPGGPRFVKPKALLDPDVLMRIAPTGGADPLQGSNVRLLSQLLQPGVFQRMAEAKALALRKAGLCGHRPAEGPQRWPVQRAG